MNDDRRPPDPAELPDHELLGELIRRAGPRPTADDYLGPGFREVAAERWQSVVVRRRRRAWVRRGATVVLAAAAAAGFAAIGLRLLAPSPGAAPLARVERVAGELEGGAAGAMRRLSVGDDLETGAHLGTGAAGGAAVRLASGIGIRVDRGSRLVLVAENRLTLERGALYVDASGAPDEAYLDVETELGTVRDVGTVYQVRDDDHAVKIQVRQGRVVVRNAAGRHEADAGTRLTLAPDGSVERSPQALHGPDWSWIYAASPAFELEGATLADYLDWLARETGWYVRFAAAEGETLLATRLHGSLEGVPPEQTPELVLPGCGLTHRLDEGTILLEAE